MEIEVIGHVHHRHLVRLLGFCCTGSERLLVYEFVSGGNLSARLRAGTGERGVGVGARARVFVCVCE